MTKESVDEPKADEGLNTNYKADNEKSKVDEDLKLLPHLVHTKLGNALLLQFILSDKDQDVIGLRYWGFVIGLVTLAICLHASTMGFIFKSFSKVCRFNPEKTKQVRKMAHFVNNTLCCIQVIVTNIMFFYCLVYKNDIVFEKSSRHQGCILSKGAYSPSVFMFPLWCLQPLLLQLSL